MQAIIEKGVTTDNVTALEQLCSLYERMQDKDAERAFNKAFAELQSKMPRVVATKPVPNKDGTIRYRFAPYEEILEQVQPFLTQHGFSVSFNTKPVESDRLAVICTLRHISGHSQSNEFAVRIGNGPPGATLTQADGAAKTYAKRGALSDALNIVVDHDDDAKMIGKPIGQALAEELQARVKACGANEEEFLKFAGAAHYEAISDDRYDTLDALLTRKERGAGKKNEKGEYAW